MALPRARFTPHPPTIHVEGVVTEEHIPQHTCKDPGGGGGVGVGGDLPMDKYIEGIELSNTCRQFYVNRMKASASVKQRLGIDDKAQVGAGGTAEPERRGSTRPSSLATAMHELKRQMALLMDRDLELMAQLLTLNERIEELKWQRKLTNYSRGSLESTSNTDASASVLSMFTSSEACTSTLEMRDVMITKYPSPSELSLYSEQYPCGTMGNIDRSIEEQQLQIPPESNNTGYLSMALGKRNVNRPTLESTSDLGSSDDVGSQRSRGSLNMTKNNASLTRWSERRDLHTQIQVPHNTRGTQDQQSFDSGIHNPEPSDLIEIML